MSSKSAKVQDIASSRVSSRPRKLTEKAKANAGNHSDSDANPPQQKRLKSGHGRAAETTAPPSPALSQPSTPFHPPSALNPPPKGPPSTSISATSTLARSASSRSTIIDLVDEDTEPEEDAPGSGRADSCESSVEVVEEVGDAEQELNKRMKRYKSALYAFFKKPYMDTVGGREAEIFACGAEHCRNTGGLKEVRRYMDTGDSGSTSSLKIHAIRCFGKETVTQALLGGNLEKAKVIVKSLSGAESGLITSAFARLAKANGKISYSTTPLNTTEIRAEHVRWVCENKRPFQIVKDRAYNRMMKTGRPSHYVPSPETVSRDVRHVFAQVRRRIRDILVSHVGAIHFALDAWSSPNNKSFVAFTAHFERQGKTECLLLDIVELAMSHTGVNLAETFHNVLREFKLEDKIHSVSGDNASNNDALVDELEIIVPAFAGSRRQVRCFLHVLNLVAQSMMRQFDLRRAWLPPDNAEMAALLENIEEEEAEAASELPEDEDDDNLEGFVDVMDDMTGGEQDVLEECLKPAQLVLAKLRKFAFALKRSTTLLLPAWYATLKVHGLRERIMSRDVRTRWNSTYDMLNFAVDYKVAINAMISDRNNNLRKFEMDEEEWELAHELHQLLEVFKDATMHFSRHDATLADVIPEMDDVDETLASIIKKTQTVSIAIRSAAQIGLRTLNKYYSLTDFSENYRLAMILHPKYKLKYFAEAKWEAEWIEAARALACSVFENEYVARQVPVPHEDAPANEFALTPPLASSQPPASAALKRSNTLKKRKRDTSTSQHAPDAARVDELTRYLSTEPEVGVENAMQWWNDRRYEYPVLSRMALDYLSIPPTSVEVERVFSQGRLILSHVRNRLSVQSTRALLCLGDWSLKGLIKDKDILAKLPSESESADVGFEAVQPGWDAMD